MNIIRLCICLITLALLSGGASAQTAAPGGPHKLAPLPYAYDALEPAIDALTMQTHHGKHHAAYVNNLNAALAKYPDLNGKSAEDLVRDLKSVPEEIREAVRNNAGGHVNHTMFWEIMKPKGGGDPVGKIAEAIKRDFGNFENFKRQFNDSGTKRFGSGRYQMLRKRTGLP